MTTSTPTNEGNAIAGTMIAQAKGDVHAARRVAGEAHACLTKIAVALDPTFKPSDDAARIVELETQLRNNVDNDDALTIIAERDAAQAQVVELTSARADLDDRCDVLRRDLDTVRIERNNLSRSITALGERVLDTERQRDNFRDELTRVKAELAQVRAVNFDAPRTMQKDAIALSEDEIPTAAEIDDSNKNWCKLCGKVELIATDRFHCAACIAKLNTPAHADKPIVAAIVVVKPVQNDESLRPATVSEAAWASMSPMMQKFAAARATAVK